MAQKSLELMIKGKGVSKVVRDKVIALLTNNSISGQKHTVSNFKRESS